MCLDQPAPPTGTSPWLQSHKACSYAILKQRSLTDLATFLLFGCLPRGLHCVALIVSQVPGILKNLNKETRSFNSGFTMWDSIKNETIFPAAKYQFEGIAGQSLIIDALFRLAKPPIVQTIVIESFFI